MKHVLYETQDADAPDAIKDRNGEVVLAMCRHCNRGEAELDAQPVCEGSNPVAIPDTGFLILAGTDT